MHAVPFTLALTVWVPSRAFGSWIPCPLLGSSMTEEFVRSCSEIKSVLSAQGRLVARILTAPAAPRYDGFRVWGRRKDTGLLVAGVEWQRSLETHELVLSSAGVWTTCEYVHAEDFDAQQLVA